MNSADVAKSIYSSVFTLFLFAFLSQGALAGSNNAYRLCRDEEVGLSPSFFKVDF
jgi:hypothetical protein